MIILKLCAAVFAAACGACMAIICYRAQLNDDVTIRLLAGASLAAVMSFLCAGCDQVNGN